ncbi:MAG: ABC transporter ATP-binding protein, partial [Lachnospiraceae bacterium]|nr:ABC transporter ATP-binding protein [Lachnospiraceae bacterium]
LLNLVAGFLQPTEGSVTLNGQEIKEPGPDRGMVFQEPTLYNWLSVFDNVAFGLKMRGVAKAEIKERVTHFLELTGLAGFEQFPPYELSGGMKQRVALSRVLVSDPKVLLMDEPFSALDPSTRQEMQSLLDSLQDRRKCTILLVTHDINEALYLADRILVFSARPGRIIDEIDLRGVSFTDRRSEIIERPDMTALHKRIMEAVTQKE